MAHVSLHFWAERVITLLSILKNFHTQPSRKIKKDTICKAKISLCSLLRSLVPEIHSPSLPRNSRKSFSESSFCLKSHSHTFPIYFLSLEYFFLKLSHFFWAFLCEISMFLFYITLKKDRFFSVLNRPIYYQQRLSVIQNKNCLWDSFMSFPE